MPRRAQPIRNEQFSLEEKLFEPIGMAELILSPKYKAIEILLKKV